jgi:signal transduction histidine kinase
MLVTVQWSNGIEDAWSKVATFIPKFLGFLIVLIVGYIVVKMIAKALDKVLERVGFDKMVEKGGLKRVVDETDYHPSDVIAKIAFVALMLLVLQMAFGVFGANPVSDLLGSVIAYLPKVIAAILIVVIVGALAAAVREILDASIGGLSYGKTLANAAAIAITVVGAFAALNELAIATAIVNGLFFALLAIVVGVTVLAVGLGGVQPMRTRWENVLARYDEEKPKMQQEISGAKDRISQRAQEAGDKAQSESERARNGSSTARSGR